MSDNIRELRDDELDIVSGAYQSAAFGAIVNNRSGCSTLVPSVTNNGIGTGLGYGGLSGSYGAGGPCSGGGGRTFLLMDLPTQISMEFAEANEAGPHGRAS
jgi:hypothetical protein